MLLMEHDVGWTRHICIHLHWWFSRPCLREAEAACTTRPLGVYIACSGLAQRQDIVRLRMVKG